MKISSLLLILLASASCSHSGWKLEPVLSASVSVAAQGVRLDVPRVSAESSATSYDLGLGATAISPSGARIRTCYTFPVDDIDRFGTVSCGASWRF